MEYLRQFILNNQGYITSVGTFFGIVGTTLAVIFYFKSLKRKNINYYKKDFNLLNHKLTDLSKILITCNGADVKQLTATNLAIWNSGDITLEKTDFVELDPLRITTINPEITIFDIELIESSDASNNFSILKNDLITYYLKFDYLDKNQGVIIKILHSGLDSGSIVLEGKMKGIGQIKLKKNIYDQANSASPRNRNLLLMYFSIIDKYFWLVYGFGAVIFLYLSLNKSMWYLFASVLLFYGSYITFPRRVIPSSLNSIINK